MSSAAWNPPNPYHATEITWDEPRPPARLEVRELVTGSILTHNTAPDIPFDWGLNPYRGCTHACAYCYARRTHEFLDHGAGTDFERVIYVRPDAAEKLAERFERRSWRGELVNMSGVTDPYQPLERKLRITRGCLEVFARYRNPVSILTRSPLVTRDIDLLGPLAELGAATVTVSVPILDRRFARKLEPGAPDPYVRIRAIAALVEAGIPVGVSVSPVIPGVNDSGIAAVLEAAREAGASWAWMSLLRTPGSVGEVFRHRVEEVLPERAGRIQRGLEEMGDVHEVKSGEGRRRPAGARWAVLRQMFDVWCQRLGYGPSPRGQEAPRTFRRPTAQMSMFG